jgi:hypothetical protein
VSSAALRVARELAPAALLCASALGIGCAAAPPARVASATHSVTQSPVTKPLAARIVAPAPALKPSDLAAVSLVQRVADTAVHHDAGAPRRLVIPAAFRVADLPLLEGPPPLDAAHAPVVAGGSEATELVVDWHATGKAPEKLDAPTLVRVGLVTSTWARLRIGTGESSIGPEAAGGIFLTCGGPQGIPQKLLPARWEWVAMTSDKGLEYHVTTAWFDPRTCTARIMEHASVTAAPLAGRLLYAFRQPGLEAGDGGELVTILGPRFDHLATTAIGGAVSSADGVLSRVTLPVRQGGGVSMIGRAVATSVQPWARKLAADVPSSGVILGVEIAQGVDDPEPIAIAYVGAPEVDPSARHPGL